MTTRQTRQPSALVIAAAVAVACDASGSEAGVSARYFAFNGTYASSMEAAEFNAACPPFYQGYAQGVLVLRPGAGATIRQDALGCGVSVTGQGNDTWVGVPGPCNTERAGRLRGARHHAGRHRRVHARRPALELSLAGPHAAPRGWGPRLVLLRDPSHGYARAITTYDPRLLKAQNKNHRARRASCASREADCRSALRFPGLRTIQ